MSEEKPKIGAGHMAAMGRQGLAELRAALYPESNVAQPTEYGAFGTATPGEVWAAKDESALDAARARASETAAEAANDKDKGPELGG